MIYKDKSFLFTMMYKLKHSADEIIIIFDFVELSVTPVCTKLISELYWCFSPVLF